MCAVGQSFSSYLNGRRKLSYPCLHYIEYISVDYLVYCFYTYGVEIVQDESPKDDSDSLQLKTYIEVSLIRSLMVLTSIVRSYDTILS